MKKNKIPAKIPLRRKKSVNYILYGCHGSYRKSCDRITLAEARKWRDEVRATTDNTVNIVRETTTYSYLKEDEE